ncbi:unnamed protein product [Prunus brigantina]
MASSSKTFLLLDFMFALVILISSEVSARELVEITKPATTIGVDPHRGKRGQLTPASPESTIRVKDVDPCKLPLNCLMKCSRGHSTPAHHTDYLRISIPPLELKMLTPANCP